MEDVVLESIEGKGCHSVDVTQSHTGSNSFHLPNKSYPINICKHEGDCRDFPFLNATSEISLTLQEDLFSLDKAVTDEGMQTFEKDLNGYDKVHEDILTTLNICQVNCSCVLTEETTEKENLKDLKPLSTIEGLPSLAENLQRDVGDGEYSCKCSANMNETREKNVKTDLSFLFVNKFPVEQHYSGSSVSEEGQLETKERATCLASLVASEEIIEPRSHCIEEFTADFSQVGSSNHIESTVKNQNLFQTMDQDVEKDEGIRNMVSDKDLSEEDKMSAFSDTVPNRIDNTKVSSDYVTLHDVASISVLDAGDTSIEGNMHKVMDEHLSIQSQNDVGNEEHISDGTTEARTSFVHLIHGDSNLLEPSSFSGSVTTYVPYSGSISFQSESSTTSGRSFAFPILQQEWSNSPVRMAKANRRHLRQQRWKKKLICCKF